MPSPLTPMATLLLGNSPPIVDLPLPRPRLRRLLPPPDSAASTSRSYLGIRSFRIPRRSGPICRAAANDPDGGWDGEEEGKNWESEMKTRLRELEEMRELERRAADLQSLMEEETSEEKRERVRRELEKLAKEQAERRETAKLMFELGQKAYGKGTYGRAVEFLEGALTIIPRPTLLGGEVQVWLAMAYEANNRHRDCITLYEQLENQHPSSSIRRQAAELRYILEAPKLKISKDEMVTIPLIGSSYDNYAATWSDKSKDEERRKKPVTGISSSSQDYWGDFLPWRSPSGWGKNRLFWVAVSVWLGLVGVALLIQS